MENINTLCLSGGGINAISFIGVLEHLCSNKLNIDNIINYYATSAGSIICFLLNIGYTPLNIGEIIYELDFAKLIGEIILENYLEDWGIVFNMEHLIKLLNNKLNIDNITFIELYNKTNKKLNIIGTNISKYEQVLYNYEKTPDFSVLDAIKISTCVPMLFKPVKIGDDYFVDGALSNNFPIDYCDPKTTLGISINWGCPQPINSLSSYISNILNMISYKYFSHVDEEKYMIIKINPECENNFSNLDFTINVNSKIKLLRQGQLIAQDFLERLAL